MRSYKMITKSQLIPFSSSVFVWYNDQKLCVPADPDNTDYQSFLLWKSEGNTPLPADVVTGE